MPEIKNIDDVLSKIEQMHESLRMGDEIFPLISDIFIFIREIVPLMLEVNAFMKDSSSKIPTASDNLNNVTKTTELAAHEIMDRLDTMSTQLESLKTKVKDDNGSEKSLELIEAISSEASEIIFAFQFQDITSQQLEHVHRILEAIYEKFIGLFNSTLKLRDKSILGKEIVHAMENELGTKQQNKSDDFHKKTEDKMHHKGISQDDIDKYFK